jgi:hypothetical protein
MFATLVPEMMCCNAFYLFLFVCAHYEEIFETKVGIHVEFDK